MAAVFYARYLNLWYILVMWKVKLDDKVWLAEAGATTNESDARQFPDMPSVQDQLKKVRLFMPYKEAMVVYDDPAE